MNADDPVHNIKKNCCKMKSVLPCLQSFVSASFRPTCSRLGTVCHKRTLADLLMAVC